MPLQGADVVLGTYSGFPSHVELKTFVTGQDGRVVLKRIRKWELQIFLPDAVTGFGWSLCVSRPGYQAVAIPRPEFGNPVHVAMPASVVTSECRWSRGSAVEVIDWKAGKWIEVEGGTWKADGASKAVGDDIQAEAETHAHSLGRELRPWSEYLFQYQGRTTGSTPYLYIKALCQTPADFNLQKTFYEGTDGDACSFEVTYDMTRGRFDSFQMKAAVTDSPSR